MAENITSTTAWALVDAIKSVSQTPSKTTGANTATVTDIDDDGTVWVLIPGAEDKTPVNGRILAAVTPGDVVQIEIDNGQLSILGNTTTPAVGQAQVDDSIAPVSQMAGQALIVVNELQANKADIKELNAAKAHIDELEATKASIEDLTATNAQIENLQANKANVTDLTALNATITNLDATKANISDLTATNAHITQLEANKADINLANVNNAWIENGLVRDAAITDAKIAGVSANKLTAGTIDANSINVTNLRADNLKVTRINGQPVIGGYSVVDLTNHSNSNPNEEGWYELVNGSYVLSTDTAVQSSKVYYRSSDSVGLYDRDTIDSMVNSLNNRIDAQIETWTSDSIPTLFNYPAVNWTTNDDKQDHIGDICYVNNNDNQSSGFIYRFAYDNANQVFEWILIRDNNITDALGRISDLEDFETETTSWIQETDEGLTTIRRNHTSLTGRVDSTIKSSTQLWFTKSDSTLPNRPTGNNPITLNDPSRQNTWNLAVPSFNEQYPYYFYCWQYLYSNDTYGWSAVILDTAIVESQQSSQTAVDTANAAQDIAEISIKSSTMLWYASNSTTSPAKPYTDGSTSHIMSTSTNSNLWTLAVPAYSSAAPYYHYCYQQQRGDDKWQWSDPVYDRATSIAMEKAQAAFPTESFRTFEQTVFKTLVDETDEQRSEIIRLGEINDSLNVTELLWEQGSILSDIDDKNYESCKTNSATAIRTSVVFSLTAGIHVFHLASTYSRISDPSGNPSSQEWYVINNAKYVLTTDTEVSADTVYYSKLSPWQVLLIYFDKDGLALDKTSWLVDGNSDEAPTGTTSCAAVLSKISGANVIPSEIVDAQLHISPYSITLLNTVNRIRQTADTNSAVISNVTTLLGTNTNGTTRNGDILHRITAAETSITQNTNAISIRATKNEVQQARPAYAFCSTTASNSNKIATIDPAVTGYSLYKGAVIAVTFNDTNTSATPTLNVNSTGNKQIRSYAGTTLTEAEYKWSAGATIDFVYDGTYWRFQDNGTVNRISSAEASILVNSNNIDLKVSKNGVISSINQSAETIKINAGKVVIGGFTVTNTALYSGANVQSSLTNAVALTTVDFERTVDSIRRGKLRLAIGSKFGVDSDGVLFAHGANIKHISASNITGGQINANLIKAGKIRDADGHNEWDLTPGKGTLVTTSMTAKDATLIGNLNFICQDQYPKPDAVIPSLIYQNKKVKKIQKNLCKFGGFHISSISGGYAGAIRFVGAKTKNDLNDHYLTYGMISGDSQAGVNIFVPKNKTVSGKELKASIKMPGIHIKGLVRFDCPRLLMNGENAFNGSISINNIFYRYKKKQHVGSINLVFRNGLLVNATTGYEGLITKKSEPIMLMADDWKELYVR